MKSPQCDEAVRLKKKGRAFFCLPKKKQKDFYFLALFSLSGRGLDLAATAELKVFWFFSSEKNILPHSSGSSSDNSSTSAIANVPVPRAPAARSAATA